MAANLATNIKTALKDLNIRSVTGWTLVERSGKLQSIRSEQS